MSQTPLKRSLSEAILVVEDDDGQARLALRSLRKQGFEVAREATGQGCLAALASGRDYFVLLDLGLPDMDGIEVLQQIVAHSEETPVIVVTGVDDLKVAVGAIQKGAWDYIVKRVDLSHLEELPNVIRRNLDRQRLVRERNMFLSMLSHDIKNPVQVILGYAEMIQQDPPDMDDLKHLLERIKDNAGRILELVRDFVEMRKIEAGNLVLNHDSVSAAALAREVATQQEALAARKKICLDTGGTEDELTVVADREYLQRAFTNLVDNAIKYTAEGGVVAVRARRDGGRVVVEVADNGQGIPEEDLPYIFDKYRRVRAGSAAEGSGLGLFIVRAIAEAHGGTVSVESTVGAGSTFRFDLPAAGEEQGGGAV